MVTITAKVLLNLSLDLKNNTIGLPISEITAAIAMYTITDWISYKKNNIRQVPNKIAKALKMPLAMIFEFMI